MGEAGEGGGIRMSGKVEGAYMLLEINWDA